jgi:NAD-dependent histone deacetylase SIR2
VGSLNTKGKLQRWYTQNVDGLERKTFDELASGKPSDEKVVLLHGAMEEVYCTTCKYRVPFCDEMINDFKQGQWRECENCKKKSATRIASGKRGLSSGFYRPDIVLYGEPHHKGDVIGQTVEQDLRKITKDSVIIVAGTSLKVIGVKRLIKDLVRQQKALLAGDKSEMSVIYLNKIPFSRTEWKTIFDLELLGDCDAWVERMLKPTITKTSIIPVDNKENKHAPIRAFFSTVKSPSTVRTCSLYKKEENGQPNKNKPLEAQK